MTDLEFFNLKNGDTVITTGVVGGAVSLIPAGLECEVDGQTTYDPNSNVFKCRVRPKNKSSNTAFNVYIIMYPDEIDFKRHTTSQTIKINGEVVGTVKVYSTSTIKCECGAAALGIKLYAPGHSSWCPGKQNG